ncbi:E3 ubiquitin-protein ligase ZFP91 [Liparis tanakae]|uniref:E3 ubiquitin-protein ligase ZFP91 n=1 Tax=Liparis tanakae TaxID=230148 RepID=A0A4Z2J5K9_9TELE|nr:E3 ubiquitin-protein ligase ZFP91 [Liparis tanakae]
MNSMDSGEDEVSCIRPGIEIIGDSTEAAKPTAVSTEPPSGRRGSKRLVKTTVNSPDAGDSGSGVRVLRARRVEAGRTNVNNVKNATCRQTPNAKSMHRGRGRPVGSRSKNTQEGKERPPTEASCTTPETACKPEAEMEAEGETGSLKASDDKEKLRRNTTLKQKEVKKEESEKEEEEEDNIKKEESTEIVVQIEDGVDHIAEPPRKRGRQQKDDNVPRLPKQRKKPPVQYVRCEIEGCGTVLAHPRYLQHHIKYQHLLKKKYVCDHPSCGRLFRLQKQLLRHAKHHTDQRDYICEYCARAFKSSHNLAVHRMIHTGEKPIQCEICGFTCRQKASLNWHMKKHDAESSYQFSCSICGKKFEKKDSVVAHKAKSHPEVLIAEALAANGGSVISSPTLIPDTVQVLASTPETVSALNQSNSTLTPLHQVSQGQFLQLPTHRVVQVAHPQQAPTLLHLTAASPTNFSGLSHPQLIQFSALPASTVASMTIADPQSTLLTLSSSSVTTLASTASLASQQAMQWGRETDEDEQLPGEGELWDRVVVGGGHQDVEEMMWEGNEERRKEDEGIVWEREGGRHILLQCAEVHGDSLI